jgi:hypothetical protein
MGLLTALVVLLPGSVHAAITAASTSSIALSSATNSLPKQLLPYASIIGIVLTFVDGLIFGIAIKKAIVSAILIVVGLLLAGFIGLAIPFLSTSSVTTHLVNIFVSQARLIGPIIYTIPLFWIIGFALGIWKG